LALAGFLTAFLLAATAITARAALGGDEVSIQSDVAAMSGKMAESAPGPAAPYKIKSFVTGNGATVREYVSPSGPIFGIAWQGRRPPDLKVLLGSYYPEFAAASGLKEHVNLHRDTFVGPNAIVMLSGRMGHLAGRAYVPALAPSGVDAETVVK
ncbi:MAG: DUF2844 domain-containing protein, partial [Candidatus Binataceae bacterium]|jgi:hypothetical protein